MSDKASVIVLIVGIVLLFAFRCSEERLKDRIDFLQECVDFNMEC